MLETVHELANWVVSWAYTPYGGIALGLLAFAESSFFPIPPDVLLIALCLLSPDRSVGYATICSVGSVAGGAFGYGLGLFGGRPLIRKLFSETKIRLVQDYYQKYDAWAVGIAAFTPIPYKVFTVSAGVFLLDFKRFMLASVLGRSGRFFLVGTLFYFFGEPIAHLIEKYLNLFSVLFILLLILGFVVIHYLSRKNMKAAVLADPSVPESRE